MLQIVELLNTNTVVSMIDPTALVVSGRHIPVMLWGY